MIAFKGVDVGCLLCRVERLRMFEFPTIFARKYGSRKQEMVQNSYLTDTQWVLLVSSLGCIIENGQKMERKGGSSVTKSFDKR